MHPADFKKLSPEERWAAVLSGDLDGLIDWRIERVAHLCGLDPLVLDDHVTAERGWESHDAGFLHEVVVSARLLIYGRPE